MKLNLSEGLGVTLIPLFILTDNDTIQRIIHY